MYGVYIVDDEGLMIKSVMQTITWGENGFTVIGSSTNPQQAISDIQRLKPDLVFCDLKMPAIDGLSLIKNCKQLQLKCEFIMLSAFADFEASRKFFLMEGFDYLLKPLQQQEAELVLERLSRKLAAKNNLTPSTTFAATNTKAFDDLITYISQNFAKKYTLQSLSKQFNLSENYICNLFAKHYQSTLTIFLTNIRMQEATRLITSTDKALKEIAILCGYADYFYFCRIFKGHFNCSPTQYRQTYAKGGAQ